MEYAVTTNDSYSIKIGATGVEDVLQCVRVILGIIEGTVFLDRRLGIRSEVIDEPQNKIDELYQEIYEKIEKYEPRAEVTSIKIKAGNTEGKTSIIVGVRVDEELI